MRTYLLTGSAVALLVGMVFLCSCGGSDDDDDSQTPSDDTNTANDDSADADDTDNPPVDDDYSEPYDPSQTGPYAVGNRTMVFVDESRDDFASRGKRTLLTEVWYPADDWTRRMPRDIVRNFLGKWDDLLLSILRFLVTPEEMRNFEAETSSARDVPIYRDSGALPFVLLSHGNAGIRFQSMTVAEYLASHGYVVVAPDHIGNAVFVTLPDRLQIYNPILTPWESVDRVQDLMFLIDKFTELNADDPEGFFTGLIDLDRIGAVGHSFGAETVASFGQIDRRVKAVVEMAGFEFPIFPKNFKTPYFYMLGLEDHTMDDFEPLVRIDYFLTRGAKFLAEYINGGHYTFTDACVLIPTLMGDEDGCGSNTRHDTGEPFDYVEHDKAFHIINTYITSFLGLYLKGREEMRPTLTQNLDPEEVVYSYEFEGE